MIVIFRKQRGQRVEEIGTNKDDTKRGGIFTYVHHNNRLGVLLELGCETDRVAQSERFQQLAGELALQIAALTPRYINFEDIPTDIVEEMRKGIREDPSMERVPLQKRDEVVNDKLKKALGEHVLLMQPWVKDETTIVSDLVKKVGAEAGENIVVRRFRRYALAE